MYPKIYSKGHSIGEIQGIAPWQISVDFVFMGIVYSLDASCMWEL